MPRRRPATSTSITSALEKVRQQARSLLINLRKEIRDKENELERLRHEESRLAMLVSENAAPPRARTGKKSRANSGRVDWSGVLRTLPKQFRAADVRAIKSVSKKRASEIFAAITRWINAGQAKRRTRGIYERTSTK